MPKMSKDNLVSAKASLDLLISAQNHHKEIMKPIDARCEEVILSICKIFNKRCWWYKYNNDDSIESSDDDANGFFDPNWKHLVEVEINPIQGKSDMICDVKEGCQSDLSIGFPIRFLFEDFEQEVIDGKKSARAELEKERIEKKEKALAAKSRKAELAASAREKLKSVLTPEEMKALKGL